MTTTETIREDLNSVAKSIAYDLNALPEVITDDTLIKFARAMYFLGRRDLKQEMENKWTPVADGMPPENVQVLVRVFEPPYVDSLDINKFIKGKWVLEQPITHWMVVKMPEGVQK